MKQPDPILKELRASTLELLESCEDTRRVWRLLKHKSSSLDELLLDRSRKQLNQSRDLLAETERPARQWK